MNYYSQTSSYGTLNLGDISKPIDEYSPCVIGNGVAVSGGGTVNFNNGRLMGQTVNGVPNILNVNTKNFRENTIYTAQNEIYIDGTRYIAGWLKESRVSARLYDNDGNGQGETLVLSSDSTIPYTKGTLIKTYDNLPYKSDASQYNPGDLPWYTGGDYSKIEKVEILDKIRPYSTTAWFYYMQKLTDIEGLHLLDTSDVENMWMMFCSDSKLERLDLSSFNTSKCSNFNTMFAGCTSLSELNISNFSSENASNVYNMFASCTELETIIASDNFDITNISGSNEIDVFVGCTELAGGMGTIYDGETSALRGKIDGRSIRSGILYRLL